VVNLSVGWQEIDLLNEVCGILALSGVKNLMAADSPLDNLG